MKALLQGGVGRFVGHSALLWAGQMGGIVISVVAGIFITRILGPEGRGVYTWLLTLAAVGTNVALFGLDIANRRFASAEPGQIPALLKLNVAVIVPGSVFIGCVLAGIAMVQPASGQVPLWTLLAVLTVPLGALPMALIQVLLAQGRAGQAALATFLPKLVLAAGAAVLLAMAWVGLGTALLVNLLAGLVGVALPVWWLRRELKAEGHMKTLPYLRSVWRTGAAMYASGLAYYLMQKSDVLLVGVLLGKAETGYYSVASNMVDIMMTPVAAIAMMMSMRLAAGEGRQAGFMAREVVLATMGLTVAGCVLTFFVAPWVIPFLFGSAFEPAVPVLQLLCPAVVMLAWFMLMQNALTATGRARVLALPPVVGCVANIGLNVWLIPVWGLVGACWASILAYGMAAACATLLVLGPKLGFKVDA